MVRFPWHRRITSASNIESTLSLEERRRQISVAYRRRFRRRVSDLVGPKKRSVSGFNRHIEHLARRVFSRRNHKATLDGLGAAAKKKILVAQRSRSILLDGLVADREHCWKPPYSRLKSKLHRTIDVRDFSFFTSPQDTQRALRSIALAEAECLSGRINFLDHDCHDIGPWLVLAVMRRDMLPVFSGGAIGDQLSAVITALGLHGPLRFSLEHTSADPKDIWAFPLRSRRPAGSSRSPTVHLDPQSKEQVGGELCEAIDRWLGASSEMQLTRTGRSYVLKIVGETLDNAERYSRPEFPNDGDWSISGYMKKQGRGEDQTFVCQLAFLSVGASISETVQRCDQATQERMQEYIRMHSSALPNQQYTGDHLRTIFALQDRVSGDPDATSNGRGGTGFRDIITFFGDLAEAASQRSAARLAIISGRTCLHIASVHCDASRPKTGEDFNIWLNPENLKELPPDSSSVVELEQDFRGTLVTMIFELDRGYLKNAVDDQS